MIPACRVLLILVATVFAGLALAAPVPAQDDPVSVSAAWSAESARPGDQRVLAVVLDMAPGWHVNPREDLLPPALDFAIPTSVGVDFGDAPLATGALQWPEPHAVAVEYADVPTVPALDGRAVVYVPVAVDADAQPGAVPLTVEVSYQACNATVCAMPRTETLALELEILPADAAPLASAPDPELFGDFDPSAFGRLMDGATEAVRFDLFGLEFSLDASSGLGLVLLLLVAALGGLLLNFTPCVLPVIPIKIMSLSHAAGNRSRCLGLGATMSLGVIAFWVGLGALVASVAGFTATNQLFQYPAFTIGVGIVIAAMAVGMCGLFTIQLPQAVYRFTPRQDSHKGSFGFGIMTAVLSTPCTAPFMGAAAAWSATQPASVTLGTFASIGAGMALPYLVLAAFPGLVSSMPRAGAASELIKQVMGLLMLAAAAYFVGVGLSSVLVTPPDPPSRAYWWPVAGLVAAAGIWLGWRTLHITRATGKRVAWCGFGLLLVVAAAFGGARLTAKGPIDWVSYTPERLAQSLADGRVVVLDFTAEWCLNCKALEHGVLESDAVVALLAEEDVVPMKVDLTGNNGPGAELLQSVGRVAIPLLVVSAPDGTETLKSDFYTADQVLDAVAAARGDA